MELVLMELTGKCKLLALSTKLLLLELIWNLELSVAVESFPLSMAAMIPSSLLGMVSDTLINSSVTENIMEVIIVESSGFKGLRSCTKFTQEYLFFAIF